MMTTVIAEDISKYRDYTPPKLQDYVDHMIAFYTYPTKHYFE